MKKVLLTIAMAAVSTAVAIAISPAQRGLTGAQPQQAPAKASAITSGSWSYAATPYDALGDGEGQIVTDYAAMKFDPQVIDALAGSKITKVCIASGAFTSMSPQITLFATHDLNGTPIFEQTYRPITSNLGKNPDLWNYDEITLSQPLTIESDKPLYFGIKCVENPKDYPVPFDNVPMEKDGLILRFANDTKDTGWVDYTSSYGSLAMYFTIEGNLPQNDVRVLYPELVDMITPGQDIEGFVYILNTGSNPVKSVEYTCTIGDETVVGVAQTLGGTLSPSVIAPHNSGAIILKDITTNTEGVVPFGITITKINGKACEWNFNKSVNSTLTCLSPDNGFERTVLMESVIGTWDGFSPRLLAGMDYMSSRYPADSYVHLAVHISSGSEYRDPMSVSDYDKFIEKRYYYIPSTLFDRKYMGDGSPEDFEAGYQIQHATPSVGRISMHIDSYTSSEVTFTSESEFVFPGEYTIVYLVKEDEVGPHLQTNNYAGGGIGPMWGYENRAAKFTTPYNDVLRHASNPFGVDNCLPDNIVPGEKYRHTYSLPIDRVFDIDLMSVVGILIDKKTGIVINASEVTLADAGVHDIDQNSDSGIKISIKGNEITNQSASTALVYTLTGVRVAEISEGGSATLSRGVYLVCVGSNTCKVFITQ